MKRATLLTWDQLRVGVVILIALGILIVAMYRLGQAANLFTERYVVNAVLASAHGLRVGGTVTVAGQMSGSVQKIIFLPPDADTTRNLIVVMELDKRVQEQVRSDSEARLRTVGLLGDKIVDISPGSVRYARLEEGDTVRVSSALDYEQVIAQAAEAVDDLVVLTADLKQITGGIIRGEGTLGQLLINRTLYDEMTSTVARMNTLMVRLHNPRGTVGRLMDDPELYDRLSGAVASMDTLLRRMNSPEGSFGQFLSDTALYANLTSMARNADSVMTLLASGDGFAARMLHDDRLYEELQKMVTDLNAILEDVRRDPRRYTRGMVRIF